MNLKAALLLTPLAGLAACNAPLPAEHVPIHSAIVGDDFELWLRVVSKDDAPTTAALPTVFVLDADWHFDTIAAAADRLAQQGKLPPLLLAGIGYGSAQKLADTRLRDDIAPSADAPTGHSEAFYAFLQSEAWPEIQRRYAVSASPTAHWVVGHSAGGLGALLALFQHHDFIGTVGAADPSLWVNDFQAFDIEAAYAKSHSDLPARLYLAVGSDDGAGMRSSIEELHDRLKTRGYPGLQLSYEVYPGVTHMGAAAPFLNKVLTSFAVAEVTP